MKATTTPITLAIATVLLALAAASSSHAGLVTSTASVGFNYTNSASATEGIGTTTLSNVTLGSTALAQFDPTLGVLTGTTLTLASTRTQTTSVTSTDGSNTGANQTGTTVGTGTSTASLVAPGLVGSLPSVSLTDTCTANRRGSCNNGATSSSTATNKAFGVLASNDYVGNGAVDVQAVLPQVTATQDTALFTGIETTAYQVRWAGNLALTYEYLLHAAPSFSADGSQEELHLDFGDVALGSAATLGFGLYNLFDADRAGLDLDSISGSGDIDGLTTDLSLFTALATGAGNLFQAMLDTSTPGLFEATYLLNLSDADVGAESSRLGYALTLNLRGNVLGQPSTDVDGNVRDPRNDVPEPGSLVLVAVGLAGLGAAARRQRKSMEPT